MPSRPRGEISIWPDLNPHQWFEKDSKGGMKYDAPTRKELRFQVWLALIHGADGICLFPISFDPFVSSQIPARNEYEIMETTGLVTRMAPVLAAEESPRAIHTVGDGEVIDVTTRRYDGADYVFLLNGQPEMQHVHLEVEGLGGKLTLHDAVIGRQIRPQVGAWEEELDGLDLRIWRIAPADWHGHAP